MVDRTEDKLPAPNAQSAVVDAHLHLWRWADLRARWSPLPQLARDFLPKAHVTRVQPLGVRASVLVEAGSDIRELSGLAEGLLREGHGVAVVAAVDLTAPAAASAAERLAELSYVRAARMDFESHPDPTVLTRKAVQSALKAVKDSGLRWEFLVRGEQLSQVRRLLDRYPTLPATIEHLGKPRLDDPERLAAWHVDIAGLARDTNVTCKLSYGVRADALKENARSANKWPIAELSPLVAWVLESFGAKRVMWGSDWPLCSLMGTYGEALEAWRYLLRDVRRDELIAICASNALEFYDGELLATPRTVARRASVCDHACQERAPPALHHDISRSESD